jgi:hypothetical protein
MAADKEVKFVLDLDVKDFTDAGLKAQGVISKIGSADGIKGLVDNLKGATLALGTLGAAAYAFKSAIDLSIEADHLKQIDSQFKELTSSAGISTSALKEGLDRSSAGLIDNNDLLEIANKAIVKMGKSAEKLPEIMELARKSTQVFGGDLQSNFENITTAIANGNARMLKHYGITVDAKKAVEEFAKANGIAANEISEAGKRQAILNATLAQGSERFKGVSGDLDQTKSILAVTKNAMSEIGDIFILVFDKTIGPGLKRFLIGVRDAAVSLKTYFQANFAEGMDQSNAQLTRSENKLKDLQKQIDLFNQTKPDMRNEDNIAYLNSLNLALAEQQKQVDAIRAKNQALHNEEREGEKQRQGRGGEGGRSDDDIVNHEAKKKNEEKFQKDLLDIRKRYLDQRAENVQSFEQMETNIREQNEIQEEMYQQKIQQIKENNNLTESQKDEMLFEEKKVHEEELLRLQMNNDQQRNQMLDNYVRNSENAAEGVGRAFAAQSMRSRKDLQDFGKMGQAVMQSFQRHSTYAFEKMGAEIANGANIAKSAAAAIKGIILNVIADEAIAKGSMFMLAGLWPPNPIQIGAGVGLIALGGALRSMSGGSSSGAIPAGGMGGGLGSETGVAMPVDQSQASNVSKNILPQKTVSVNIAGNLFNTSETQRTLMEMVRQETDATDFNYNKIGV